MPTLTFYATDEVKEKLEKIMKKRSKLAGTSISRGDIIVPYIRNLYRVEIANKSKAHIVGQAQVTPIISGDVTGLVKAGEQSASAQEVK